MFIHLNHNCFIIFPSLFNSTAILSSSQDSEEVFYLFICKFHLSRPEPHSNGAQYEHYLEIVSFRRLSAPALAMWTVDRVCTQHTLSHSIPSSHSCTSAHSIILHPSVHSSSICFMSSSVCPFFHSVAHSSIHQILN